MTPINVSARFMEQPFEVRSDRTASGARRRNRIACNLVREIPIEASVDNVTALQRRYATIYPCGARIGRRTRPSGRARGASSPVPLNYAAPEDFPSDTLGP